MGLIKKIKCRAKIFDDMIRPLANDKWDYFVIALDFLWCRYVFKVPLDEYLKYNFHNFKHRYRKNFILQRDREKYINVNTPGFTVSKYTFYEQIADLYAREIILAPNCGEEAFVSFLRKHKRVVIKPDNGSLGKGIDVLTYTDDQAATDYFRGITIAQAMVCEEFICQHPVLSQLNPSSVNTIRITSLLQNGEVEIIAAVLKIGAANDITDNLSLGGIGAQVDIETGILCTFGKDFDFNCFTHHPTSGVQILGLQMPYWDKVISLVTEAHKRLPQCMVLGWDIAITETGADIVEANTKPGSRIMQVMDTVPKGAKILPLLKKDRLGSKRKEYHQAQLEHLRKNRILK